MNFGLVVAKIDLLLYDMYVAARSEINIKWVHGVYTNMYPDIICVNIGSVSSPEWPDGAAINHADIQTHPKQSPSFSTTYKESLPFLPSDPSSQTLS